MKRSRNIPKKTSVLQEYHQLRFIEFPDIRGKHMHEVNKSVSVIQDNVAEIYDLDVITLQLPSCSNTLELFIIQKDADFDILTGLKKDKLKTTDFMVKKICS